MLRTSRIFLIRHGETQANSELRYQGKIDVPLNKTGEEQAKSLAKELSKVPLHKIYSSDLNRAFRTARIIAKPHKKQIVQLKELQERDFGVWENLTFQEIRRKYTKIYADWQKNPKAKIPKAEVFPKFKKRVLKGLAKITSALKSGENAAIIAHGGTNRIILHHFLGLPVEKNFWKIKQDNACLNIIELEPHNEIVSLINCHQNNFQKAPLKY